MGLIKDMIVGAAEAAAGEAVRDAAIGAAAVVVGAAEGTVKVAKGVAKGVSTAAGAIGQGFNRAGEFIRKVNEPANRKKIAKLKAECSELFLVSVNKEKTMSFYDENLELCLSFEETMRKGNYFLKTIEGNSIAIFTKKKKLFTTYYSIETSGKNVRKFGKSSQNDSKILYELDGGYSIVKGKGLGHFDLLLGETVIATIRSKPVTDVDYALSVLDGDQDMEAVIMFLGKILL